LPARTGFKTTTSDKSSRRDAFDARFNVLLYVGDNLRDFSESFAAPKLSKDAPAAAFDQAIAARLKSADDAACHWGVDWFILPNPVYGEWEKLLGDDPRARMRNTTMPGSRSSTRNSVMEPAR
jgi:acid phosphatase